MGLSRHNPDSFPEGAQFIVPERPIPKPETWEEPFNQVVDVLMTKLIDSEPRIVEKLATDALCTLSGTNQSVNEYSKLDVESLTKMIGIVYYLIEMNYLVPERHSDDVSVRAEADTKRRYLKKLKKQGY